MGYLTTHYRCCATATDHVDALLNRYRVMVYSLEAGQISPSQFAAESLGLIKELHRDPIAHELICNYQRNKIAEDAVKN